MPASHTLRVRGEDTVSDPERGMPEVLAWLGLRTDDEAIEEMKHLERSPYACYTGRPRRILEMTAPFCRIHCCVPCAQKSTPSKAR